MFLFQYNKYTKSTLKLCEPGEKRINFNTFIKKVSIGSDYYIEIRNINRGKEHHHWKWFISTAFSYTKHKLHEILLRSFLENLYLLHELRKIFKRCHTGHSSHQLSFNQKSYQPKITEAFLVVFNVAAPTYYHRKLSAPLHQTFIAAL